VSPRGDHHEVAFARQIAPSSRTVLVEGESGSGKEVLARLLHDVSSRREGPFVAVSMATVPESFVESCLFGHERGAYPGADVRRDGVFRAASGGTLFLDDITEIPLAVQSKLLRAIEAKEVLPVGSDRPVRADARIVAASSRDLAALVRDKAFRSDLYFRLAALRLEVPPLRLRPDDIPPLAEMFLARHVKTHGRPVIGFDGAAMRQLLAYPWPGNVRELSNVVERASLLCAGKLITVAELPAEVAGVALPEGGYHQAMADFERALIRSTLERVDGDRREAARVLGVSLATLYRRLEKLDLKGDGGEPGGDGRPEPGE
jgi:two-component system, NtrC family, response regulator HydG